jgi:hypothetical protein
LGPLRGTRVLATRNPPTATNNKTKIKSSKQDEKQKIKM